MSAVFSFAENDSSDRQVAQLRIPPHSIEAESSVLGGLLLDNNAWDRMGDLLVDSDFYRYEHKLIYASVGALINATKPADVITVYEHLQNLGKADEIGGLVYLNSLAQYVPSASNIRRYAEIVRERSILRKLVSASDDGTARVWNTSSGEQLGVMDGHGGPIFSVAFAPDGQYVATGSRGPSGVIIWDVNTRKGVSPIVLPQQKQEVVSLAFSPDGQMLAIVGGLNGFQIWKRKGAAEVPEIEKPLDRKNLH